MRRMLAALIVMITPILAPAAMAQDTDIVDEAAPKLAAVLIYADWCASCRVLDPKLEAVKAAQTFEGVEFVTLDYTARDDDAFFATAAEAGVGEAVVETLADGVKTGQVLLINRDAARVVGKITKDFSEAEIAGALKATALAA